VICAIASENDEFDAEIYRLFLALELGETIERWSTPMRFSGWKAIRSQLPLFLTLAEREGIRRALIGMDNDGGAQRHRPHSEGCVPADQIVDPQGCRQCHLRSWIPPTGRVKPCSWSRSRPSRRGSPYWRGTASPRRAQSSSTIGEL
jgi:hypothetical protein